MGATADFWIGHFVAWRSSGLTRAAYCRQQGLSIASFGFWRRVLDKSVGSSRCNRPMACGRVCQSAWRRRTGCR